LVLLAIEDALRGQPGITRVVSTARDEWGSVDIYGDAVDGRGVARAVSSLTGFPLSCERPLMVALKHPSQARLFVWTGRGGDVPLVNAVEPLAEQLKRLREVVDVQVVGASEAILVKPDPVLLDTQGLSFDDVAVAIRRRSVDLTRPLTVRSAGALTVETLAKLSLSEKGVTLGDVATIRVGVRDGTRMMFKGRSAVGLLVKGDMDDWAPVFERVNTWTHPMLEDSVDGSVDPASVVGLVLDPVDGEGAIEQRARVPSALSKDDVVVWPSLGHDAGRLTVFSKAGDAGLMEVLDLLARQPGLRFRVETPRRSLHRVAVQGRDVDALRKVAADVAVRLTSASCVRHASVPALRSEWSVSVKRERAGVLGVSTMEVVDWVRQAMSPSRVVLAQDPPVILTRDVIGVEVLPSLQVPVGEGKTVALVDVVTLERQAKVLAIHRVNGRRTQWVRLVRAPGCSKAELERVIKEILPRLVMPAGVRVVSEIEGVP